jgi:hypothetical protein
LGIANASVLVRGGTHGATGATARQLLAVLVGTSLGGASLLWIALDQRFARLPVRWVGGLALLLSYTLPQLDDALALLVLFSAVVNP